MSKNSSNKSEQIDNSLLLDDDQVRTEFVYIASHQLRTPLTAIKLLIELLLSDPINQKHPEQMMYLNDIYQSTGRMVRLVDDLLNVSRIETGTLRVVPEEVDLKEFLESIVGELMPISAAKNCTVHTEFLSDISTMSFDPQLMRAVVYNLVANAIKYSQPDGSSVEIVVHTSEHHGEPYVIIDVKDYGIGIPKKEQSRLFQKFFRAENAIRVQTDGSGLGLYIANKIAQLSNSFITFSSSTKGSLFTLHIPRKGSKKNNGTHQIRA